VISDRLLGTKGCVPRLPDPLIGRPRLGKLLVDGARRPATLVSGPPGTGRTTLLASWLATTAPAQAAWLTVDGQDNEPGRLETLMAAVLAEAGCAEPPGGQGLDAALDDIRRRARPCVLVLDDVQQLCSRAALGRSSST
jgi:LuxR family transcriptional regulator, maltose regulon positive regulatory protein